MEEPKKTEIGEDRLEEVAGGADEYEPCWFEPAVPIQLQGVSAGGKVGDSPSALCKNKCFGIGIKCACHGSGYCFNRYHKMEIHPQHSNVLIPFPLGPHYHSNWEKAVRIG